LLSHFFFFFFFFFFFRWTGSFDIDDTAPRSEGVAETRVAATVVRSSVNGGHSQRTGTLVTGPKVASLNTRSANSSSSLSSEASPSVEQNPRNPIFSFPLRALWPIHHTSSTPP